MDVYLRVIIYNNKAETRRLVEVGEVVMNEKVTFKCKKSSSTDKSRRRQVSAAASVSGLLPREGLRVDRCVYIYSGEYMCSWVCTFIAVMFQRISPPRDDLRVREKMGRAAGELGSSSWSTTLRARRGARTLNRSVAVTHEHA